MPLPVCNAFWEGPVLGPVAVTCLRSFVEAGHPVRLWCYTEPADLPVGIEVADAGTLVPAGRMLRHRTGTPAPFSDLFRYEVLAAGHGVWIDCDLLCLRPLPNREYLFGYDAGGNVNGSVLGLPPGSELLRRLKGIANRKLKTLPWMGTAAKAKWWVACTLFGWDLRERKWGSIGPKALSHFVKELGLAGHALPIASFYPIPLQQTEAMKRQGFDPLRFVTGETLCIHLWNKVLGSFAAEPGSFVDRVARGTWREMLDPNRPRKYATGPIH